MRYTTFGHRTGLRVSEYALGTANFGTGWGAGAEPDEARRMFDRFAEAGGTFLDTADTYQFGESEELTGRFIAADRDHFVLATKFTLGAAPQPSVSRTGNSRKNMVTSVEASLKRLGTDCIDLLWVHFPDELTPMEEILRGLDDLARSGKIHHAALSNFPAWRVSRGVTLAELRNWTPIVGIQNEYSLVERTADRELLTWPRASDSAPPCGPRSAADCSPESTAAAPRGASATWVRSSTRRAPTGRPPSSTPSWPSPRRPGPRPPRCRWPGYGSVPPSPRPRSSRSPGRATAPSSARLSEVSAAPLGVPHEVIAGSLGGIQGGDASRVIPPAVPVG